MPKTRIVTVWKHTQLPFQCNVKVDAMRIALSAKRLAPACVGRYFVVLRMMINKLVPKVNPSTHRPEGQGLLRVDPALR